MLFTILGTGDYNSTRKDKNSCLQKSNIPHITCILVIKDRHTYMHIYSDDGRSRKKINQGRSLGNASVVGRVIYLTAHGVLWGLEKLKVS